MAWIKLENGTYIDPGRIEEVECMCTIMYDRGTDSKKKRDASLKKARAYNKLDIVAKDSREKREGVVIYSTSIPIPEFNVPEPGNDLEVPLEVKFAVNAITQHIINCLREADDSEDEVIRFKKLVESRKIVI